MPGFHLAHPDGTDVPRIEERVLASGEEGLGGNLMLVDASNQYAECGADPASIYGVAATGFGASPATDFNILGTKEFPPGKLQVIKAKGQTFHAPFVGTLPANPGGSFGVIKDTDDQWKVDFDETVATRVHYLGPINDDPSAATPRRVRVIFLEANLQNL